MHHKILKILFVLLYLLPFADVINGIMIRNFDMRGVGLIFHIVLMIVLLVATYSDKKFSFGKYEKYTAILILSLVLSAVFNTFFVNNFKYMSLNRVEKIISSAIMFLCFYNLWKKQLLSNESFDKLMLYYCIIISFSSIFANVLGLGNYTYVASQLGSTGFLTGSNEPIVIYIILNVYLVYKFFKTNRIIFLALNFINIINLFYTQSKSAYLFAALFTLFLAGIILSRILKKNVKSTKYLLLSVLGAAIFFIVVARLIDQNFAHFIARQTFIRENAFSDSSFLNYVFSGRLARPELVLPIFSRNIFVSSFQILFGQGLSFGYYEVFEIDILDIFLFGGIVAALAALCYMISIAKDVWRGTRSKFAVLLILLVYFYSCTAGHLWTGGMSWTYFAVMATFLISESKLNSGPDSVKRGKNDVRKK